MKKFFRKLFSGNSNNKETGSSYGMTAAEAIEFARKNAQARGVVSRTLHDMFSILPAIEHPAPITIRGKRLGRSGTVKVHYGLLEQGDLPKDAPCVHRPNVSFATGRSPVLGIFQDKNALHVEVLSHELLDVADTHVVGADAVKMRKYPINREGRVKELLKLLK